MKTFGPHPLGLFEAVELNPNSPEPFVTVAALCLRNGNEADWDFDRIKWPNAPFNASRITREALEILRVLTGRRGRPYAGRHTGASKH